MFKKGLALALALIILTSMISCGNDAESVDGALTKKQLAFIDSLGKIRVRQADSRLRVGQPE